MNLYKSRWLGSVLKQHSAVTESMVGNSKSSLLMA